MPLLLFGPDRNSSLRFPALSGTLYNLIFRDTSTDTSTQSLNPDMLFFTFIARRVFSLD
jgi:hypothetical protein